VRHLILLRDGQRLGRGAGAGVVVARERQHDDEAQQDGEAGRQDAEDARGAIAVVEVAPLRSVPADQQDRADREARRHGDDHDRDDDVHRGLPRLATCRRMVKTPPMSSLASGEGRSHPLRMTPVAAAFVRLGPWGTSMSTRRTR
jgi:hypothetical protein